MSQKPDREEPQRQAEVRDWREVPVSEGILEVALAINTIVLASTTFISKLPLEFSRIERAWMFFISFLTYLGSLDLFIRYLDQKGILSKSVLFSLPLPRALLYLVRFFCTTPYGWLMLGFYLFIFTILICW